VLIPASLNILNLKEIFSTVLVSPILQTPTMVLIPPTPQQDALISLISSILMVPAYPAALIQEEMNGMMEATSAISLALLDISTP